VQWRVFGDCEKLVYEKEKCGRGWSGSAADIRGNSAALALQEVRQERRGTNARAKGGCSRCARFEDALQDGGALPQRQIDVDQGSKVVDG
jgi:hypothetical protein